MFPIGHMTNAVDTTNLQRDCQFERLSSFGLLKQLFPPTIIHLLWMVKLRTLLPNKSLISFKGHVSAERDERNMIKFQEHQPMRVTAKVFIYTSNNNTNRRLSSAYSNRNCCDSSMDHCKLQLSEFEGTSCS